MTVRIILGDSRDRLMGLEPQSVQTVVTSPPYFGLRDYGHADQIGLEPDVEDFVEALVAVFRQVHRVLRDDGTLWVNLGDSYASGGTTGLSEKQLIGIPWRVAFALQADGWILRQEIIWNKPNAMPESVRDRCSKSHEHIFLLTKSAQYHFDADAIAEPIQSDRAASRKAKRGGAGRAGVRTAGKDYDGEGDTRNRRSVWTVPTGGYKGAHFATYPPDLIEPCILAGSRSGDTVLDPFGGAGTTALVADRLGRHAIMIELNPDYAEMATQRFQGDAGMFAEMAA